MKAKLRRADLIEPDLSYEIVGAVLDVYHELGPGLKESIYQKAIAQALGGRNLQFKEQVYCFLSFQGKRVGHRYLDFLIENKIIVELKCSNIFSRPQILQVKEYLSITNLPLAILFVISNEGVNFKRVINQSLVIKKFAGSQVVRSSQ